MSESVSNRVVFQLSPFFEVAHLTASYSSSYLSCVSLALPFLFHCSMPVFDQTAFPRWFHLNHSANGIELFEDWFGFSAT